MSVIVSRALPDVRDGLKPVHRRILFSLHEQGIKPTGPFKKCARVVGDVMGKYHPHGDSAIYDALVRLAQPWSMGLPVVDGHGNFGSLDDGPAAAWIDLGEVMDLPSVLGALTLDLSVTSEEVALTGQLLRPESATLQRTISQLLTWAEESTERQRRERLIEQLTGICDAIDLYAVDHGLPISLAAVEDVADMRDPWGRPFDYTRPATRRRHQRYDLCSAGADGVPRTPDDICYE